MRYLKPKARKRSTAALFPTISMDGTPCEILQLSNEILLEIFLHIENPTYFHETCRRFYTIANDPHCRARRLLFRYGRHHAFCTGLILHHRTFRETLVHALLQHGAEISRYFCQLLHRYNCELFKVPLGGFLVIMSLAHELWGDDFYLDHDMDLTVWTNACGLYKHHAPISQNPAILRDLLDRCHFWPLTNDNLNIPFIFNNGCVEGNCFARMALTHSSVLDLNRPIILAEPRIQEETICALFFIYLVFHSPQEIADAIIDLDIPLSRAAFVRCFSDCLRDPRLHPFPMLASTNLGPPPQGRVRPSQDATGISDPRKRLAVMSLLPLPFSLPDFVRQILLQGIWWQKYTNKNCYSTDTICAFYELGPCPDDIRRLLEPLFLDPLEPYALPPTTLYRRSLITPLAAKWIFAQFGPDDPLSQRCFDIFMLWHFRPELAYEKRSNSNWQIENKEVLRWRKCHVRYLASIFKSVREHGELVEKLIKLVGEEGEEEVTIKSTIEVKVEKAIVELEAAERRDMDGKDGEWTQLEQTLARMMGMEIKG